MWHAWERIGKCTRFWWENPRERDHTEDGRRWEDGVRMDGGGGVDSAGLGCRPVAGCSEYGDEPSGSSATELVITKIIFNAV
jgi:hypothetical protein